MQKSIKNFGFFIFLSIFLGACTNSEADLARFREQPETGVERAEEIELIYSDSARVRTVIKAPLMLKHLSTEKPRQEFPKGVAVQFFDPNQEPSGHLRSSYAEQLPMEKKIVLRDSVRVWNNKGESLETEELIWSEIDSALTSSKFVRIQTPTEIISGYGLRANTDFSEWQLGRVTGIIQRPKE